MQNFFYFSVGLLALTYAVEKLVAFSLSTIGTFSLAKRLCQDDVTDSMATTIINNNTSFEKPELAFDRAAYESIKRSIVRLRTMVPTGVSLKAEKAAIEAGNDVKELARIEAKLKAAIEADAACAKNPQNDLAHKTATQ